MHSLTLVSALAGVSLVLAKPLAAPVAAPLITAAPLAEVVKPALERRQMDSEECSSKGMAIWDDRPRLDLTSNEPLLSWFSSWSGQPHTAPIQDLNVICSVQFPATIDAPAPISSAYASFRSASASWASKVEPTVTSLAQSCDGALSAGLELVLATDFESCTSLYGAYKVFVESSAAEASGLGPTDSVSPTPTGTTSLQPTETASSNEGTDAVAGNAESTAGAPRETGYVFAAAAAVVAVVGAVVAL